MDTNQEALQIIHRLAWLAQNPDKATDEDKRLQETFQSIMLILTERDISRGLLQDAAAMLEQTIWSPLDDWGVVDCSLCGGKFPHHAPDCQYATWLKQLNSEQTTPR